MLDENKLKSIQSRVTRNLQEGLIRVRSKNTFSEFFLKNAQNLLTSARALFDLSTNQEMQRQTGYNGFDGLLWVVNACYYGMFYMARAVLSDPKHINTIVTIVIIE